MKTLTQLLDLHEGQYAVRDGTLWLPRQYSCRDAAKAMAYVPAINLQSFANQFKRMYPEEYQQLRRQLLISPQQTESYEVSDELSSILFEVLPHFVKVLPGLERRMPTEEEILNYVCSKTKVPKQYCGGRQDLDYRGMIQGLKAKKSSVRFSAENIDNAFLQAVKNSIFEEEAERLKHDKSAQDEAAKRAGAHNAMLNYLSHIKEFEINGFGFTHYADEIWAYKRVPEYALKDFDGRIYLFPECRVAGSVTCSDDPIVIDKYKHPFLDSNTHHQIICVGHARITGGTDAEYAINAIEAGINALLYGYFGRKDNFAGYFTLDGEYSCFNYNRPSFAKYMVPRSHPKIKSGKVQITNDSLL